MCVMIVACLNNRPQDKKTETLGAKYEKYKDFGLVGQANSEQIGCNTHEITRMEEEE